MQKYFVLDTNVLIHNPRSIFSFTDNVIVIPIRVIEELDQLKTASDKKGMHARHVLRLLDKIAHDGALKEGAPLKSGGKLMIHVGRDLKSIPNIDPIVGDNQILAVAWELSTQHTVVFISKDVNLRIKAAALGITTQDYEREKVEYTSLYTGWKSITLNPDQFDVLSKTHILDVPKVHLNPNECAQIVSKENGKSSLIARYDSEKQQFVQIRGNQEAMGVRPLNLEQRFAFELLMDDSIKLVSLVGGAGTGKTLLALACGLEKIIGKESLYEKMLVARPIMPLGRDIGYLPGTKDQKLNYWMQPIFDNINFLMTKDDRSDKVTRKVNDRSGNNKMDYLLDTGLVEIEAITYIRGRSIPNQFIIIDEAQNLTPHEIKTIISRAGQGTKIVLTGDPEQIDNPYLDSNTNGLAYTAERMKNQRIAGHVLLTKSERSELASVAISVL